MKRAKAASGAAAGRRSASPEANWQAWIHTNGVTAQTAPPGRPTVNGNHDLLHESIARLAYAYWQARAGQDGSPEEDWLRAEREIRRLIAASIEPAGNSGAAPFGEALQSRAKG